MLAQEAVNLGFIILIII